MKDGTKDKAEAESKQEDGIPQLPAPEKLEPLEEKGTEEGHDQEHAFEEAGPLGPEEHFQLCWSKNRSDIEVALPLEMPLLARKKEILRTLLAAQQWEKAKALSSCLNEAQDKPESLLEEELQPFLLLPEWLLALPPEDLAEDLILMPTLSRLKERLSQCDNSDCLLWTELGERSLGFLGAEDKASLRPLLLANQDKLAPFIRPHFKRIGVVLPLSGPFSAYGQAAKDAISLAFAKYPAYSLLFRDSEASPTLALQAGKDLVTIDKVSALIGPIGQQESQDLIAWAAHWGIVHLPLGSFKGSPEDSLKAPSPASLFLRNRQEERLDALAHFAKERGHQRAAILGSTEASRTQDQALFKASWEEIGGEIVREVSLEENSGTSSKALRLAMENLLNSKAPKTAKADFDLLFLSTSPTEARTIISYLPYWGLQPQSEKAPNGIQIIGAHGWTTHGLLDRTEGLTEDLIFTDSWSAEWPSEEAMPFIEAFKARYGRLPKDFEAASFTAGSLLLEGLESFQENASSRSDLHLRASFRHHMLRNRIAPSPLGPLSFANETLFPPVSLYQVKDGRFVPVFFIPSPSLGAKSNAIQSHAPIH